MSNVEYDFGSMFLCLQEPPDDVHIDHGLFRIVRIQVQIPFIVLAGPCHIPEMDMKDSPFLDLFNIIVHFSLKAEGAGLKS